MTFSLAALPALALLAATASAQDGAYLELGAGFTSTEDVPGLVGDASLDAGYAVHALLGYEWEEALGSLDFGLEAEGTFSRQNFDDQLLGAGSSRAEYLSTSAVFVNGVLTWPYSDEIAFYGGVGAGIATSLNVESKDDAASSFSTVDDTAAIFQGKLGIRFTMAENMDWFLQYRHTVADSVEIEDSFLDQSFDYELEQDVVEVGLRYML